ncbi:MAG TPA: hypothetical protein ENI92_09200 [Bacteroidetes bacterium]|nr:hypothetical protein [Bacteroidota bacterium]
MIAVSRRRKSRSRVRRVRRALIVVAAAVLFAFFAVVIAQLLDRPITAYYPHDDERGVQQQVE